MIKAPDIFEKRFRTIFEQSPFSIQIFSPDGRTILVNSAYKKLWGIDDKFVNEFILGKYNILQDPIIVGKNLMGYIQKAFSGEVVEMPPFYYDPAEVGMPGKAAWTVGLFYPLKDNDGKINEIVLIHDEVTKEHQEREQKERLLQIQSFLSEVTALLHTTLDYDTILEQIATAAIPTFADGCIVDILEGEHINRLLTKHSDPAIEALMHTLRQEYPPSLSSPQPTPRVIRSGEPELLKVVDFEVIKERTLDERHASLIQRISTNSHIAVPLLIRGKVIGALNFHITSKRQPFDEVDLETAVELGRRAAIAIENARLYKKTQAAVQEREDFISIASHELKTPITSLKLQWEVASRTINDSDTTLDPQYVRRLAAISNRQLDRLTRLVEDMLDIGRISSGKLAMNKKKVDLDWVVRDVADRFSDQLKDLGIELKLNRIDQDSTIFCDHFRLEQVITNLLTNAIRYGNKTAIHISVEKSSDRVVLKVRDSGKGIPLEHQERIFERFVRGISVDDAAGLGVGLYISREIVNEHNGKLWVQSAPQQGSTFIMELPSSS